MDRTYNKKNREIFKKNIKSAHDKDAYLYTTNLEKKILNPPNDVICDYICLWSDLLGFGKIFFDKSWNLDNNDFRKIRERLLNAHNILMKNVTMHSKNLILNDGLCKVIKCYKNKNQINNILNALALEIYSCIKIHAGINIVEHENEYPGTRSVISCGKGMKYTDKEIKIDDLVLNYTKKNPHELSNLANQTSNPTLLYNPSELQMNTAFSKAYILEAGGSELGIKGCELYIDEDVFSFISKLIEGTEKRTYFLEFNEYNQFLVPYESNDLNKVHFGFKLSKEIVKIEKGCWKTKLHKVIGFYPFDEPIDEFEINLHDEEGNLWFTY